jgi:UDP-glucuronate 4-epimerase
LHYALKSVELMFLHPKGQGNVALQNAVLVTGANGLLGRMVADRLHDAGRSVVGMDQGAPGEEVSFPFVQADINDIHRLYSTLTSQNVTHVVHCGAVSGRVAAGDNSFAVLETNVRGTATVFEAARNVGVSRIVLCSSAAAYGNQVPSPLNEDQPLNATTVYGASKACCEAIMRAYSAQHGLDAIALRIFQVFGPRRTTECYIRLMIENALRGQSTHVAHAADSRRQYVYVDDVVDALLLALDCGKLPRQAYNVSGDTSLTLAEISEVVRGVVPGVRVTFGNSSLGGQYRIRDVDLSIARKELGYFPKVSLKEGISRYAIWLKDKAGMSCAQR